MTTTLINTTPIEGIDFNATYTVYNQAAAQSSTNTPDYPGLPFQIGTVAKGSGDSEFVFVKAGATINLGDVCVITSTTQAANPITTTLALFGLEVGVAQVAIASGSYGWLQRNGACANINVAASCVQNVQLAATATAGVLDDAVTAGLKNVNGIIITTTVTGAATTAGTLNNPVVGITN
jgi:hypothetical protein